MSGSHAWPTPYDVVLASLAQPLAGAGPETRAEFIVAALQQHGHLPMPDTPPTRDEAVQAAQWLAAESRHPRYTQTPEGWRKLLESESDALLAAATANRGADEATRDKIAAARRTLTRALG